MTYARQASIACELGMCRQSVGITCSGRAASTDLAAALPLAQTSLLNLLFLGALLGALLAALLGALLLGRSTPWVKWPKVA